MAFRTFIDSAGREWQAFDVVPRPDARRRYDRRSGPHKRETGLSRERRDSDRRLTVGRRSLIGGGPESGWLCFECGDERRRLAPIPSDWRRCTDRDLETYRNAARPVRADSEPIEPTGGRPL